MILLENQGWESCKQLCQMLPRTRYGDNQVPILALGLACGGQLCSQGLERSTSQAAFNVDVDFPS